MDPSKSAAGPPTDFHGGEKSSMGQSAPPPYYDNPGAGPGYNPGAGPGYNPGVGPGYNPAAGPGYNQGYAPQPGYGTPAYGQQQYLPQPGAIIAQPTVYVTQGPLNPPVNDYLGYSIFTLLCCCLPLGVAALIYSITAREANSIGDRMKAEQSSRTAKTLNHVALGLGLGMIVLCIIYVVVVASIVAN